ncbi:MAG: DUF6285 domain-containing protein [Actinomycetota bacterium]
MSDIPSDYPYPQDSLHGAPSAIELVESVREWLERDVSPQVEGRLRFHTRVAVNVLATVQRELELGPEQEADHRERLERLGVASERELADAVRSGAFDDRTDELIAALRETVTDRLRVANPRYLAD